MTITTEIATVYRGGGRRWFTKDSAINAEAKAFYRTATKRNDRCECETIVWQGSDIDDYCKYHDHENPIFGRYMRYAKHCISKATT